jgi:predicted AAA+ superfamily ATPase
VSPASLCADLELSRPTLSKYIDFFERSFITFMLPNYAATEESIQRRGRKLYFVDGAVRNAALLRGLAPLTDSRELGLLYENAPASHLHALAQQAQVRAYHWRDGKTEVDLIYDDPHAPLAFEVASSASHHTTGLVALAERHKRFRGRTYLIYPDAPATKPTGDTPGRLPLDVLLCAIGVHAEAALARRFSS